LAKKSFSERRYKRIVSKSHAISKSGFSSLSSCATYSQLFVGVLQTLAAGLHFNADTVGEKTVIKLCRFLAK
jgi:hypothetical protein